MRVLEIEDMTADQALEFLKKNSAIAMKEPDTLSEADLKKELKKLAPSKSKEIDDMKKETAKEQLKKLREANLMEINVNAIYALVGGRPALMKEYLDNLIAGRDKDCKRLAFFNNLLT
jgi:hypothetical protein